MPYDRKDHPCTPEEERAIREAALDETIEASFPASDPPSSIPDPADTGALIRQHSGDDGSDAGASSPR